MQAADTLSLFLPEIGFDRLAIYSAMAFAHDTGGSLELGDLVCEVGACAALLLAGGDVITTKALDPPIS